MPLPISRFAAPRRAVTSWSVVATPIKRQNSIVPDEAVEIELAGASEQGGRVKPACMNGIKMRNQNVMRTSIGLAQKLATDASRQ